MQNGAIKCLTICIRLEKRSFSFEFLFLLIVLDS